MSDWPTENLLMGENDEVKLGDFGLAVDLSAERANTRAGTLDYMVRGPPARRRAAQGAWAGVA